jgi:hypothetical protein
MVTVAEVDGVLTQARTLDEIAPMAADAVALMLDLPLDSVEVAVTFPDGER